jgi:regulatory protein
MSGSGARATTAIEFAIGIVAARSLPEKKLREKIAARYSEDETDAAMERLRELRMVDDAAWAERFIRDRSERCRHGSFRIRGDLVRRGIPPSIADAALADTLSADVQADAAKHVLESLRRRLPTSREGVEDAVAAGRARASLFRRMIARGYSSSLVRQLLDAE